MIRESRSKDDTNDPKRSYSEQRFTRFTVTCIVSFIVFVTADGTMALVRILGYPRICYSTA